MLVSGDGNCAADSQHKIQLLKVISELVGVAVLVSFVLAFVIVSGANPGLNFCLSSRRKILPLILERGSLKALVV
jgi:hypothetical protein